MAEWTARWSISNVYLHLRGLVFGGVKDVYVTYQTEGDHFCSRMLSLLPLLEAKFAAAPPIFMRSSATLDEIYAGVSAVFTAFDGRGPLAAVLNRCLASLAYHKDKVLALCIWSCAGS